MKRLTMNEDGQFSATGKIEDKFYKTPLHELMAALLQEISILGRSYKKHMQNDQRLLGQEKVVLRNSIDCIIQIVLALRFDLDSKHPSKKPLRGAKEGLFTFTMDLVNYDYTLKGHLLGPDWKGNQSFLEWYQRVLKTNVQNLLGKVQESVKDGVISREETDELVQVLDLMLYNAITMFYRLEHTAIQQ